MALLTDIITYTWRPVQYSYQEKTLLGHLQLIYMLDFAE